MSDTTPFTAVFVATLALNALMTFRSSDYYQKFVSGNSGASSSATTDASPEERLAWIKLIRSYLLVYLLATCSDWLQGPYVYALYADYGYSQHEIAVLFVAGFGSSMVFGSFIGGMADAGGRKRFVLIFCGVYAASCITKRKKIISV
jgi:predicted MFS family arabinose efflux permease